MGALGWSEGAGVSSVVCARAPIDSDPESAKANTAKLDMNLSFITTFLPTKPSDINNSYRNACCQEEWQVPCQSAWDALATTLLFSAIEEAIGRVVCAQFEELGRPHPM